MSRLRDWWHRLTSPWLRKWGMTIWWVLYPAGGIILVGLGQKPDTFGAIVLYVLISLLGVTCEQAQRKAKLNQDVARILAEYIDRKEPGEH